MIQCQSLHFRYSRKAPLFENLSLSLQSGHIVGLLGKNGAGKTTLLKLMAGFLKPLSGFIRVHGHNPFDREIGFLDEIAYVPEDFKLPNVSVRQLASQYGVFYSRFQEELYFDLIRQFDLSPEKQLGKISFGQSKKALLAFALAVNPKVLFLDEPMNGLDIPAKQSLRSMLLKHIPEQSLALISTHQVREISNLVSSVAVIDKGHIIMNADLVAVSEKVVMRHSKEKPEAETVLYDEPAMGGYLVVEERKGESATELDLELLFNAVNANPEFFRKLMNVEVAHA